jgi:hypothetical protein
MHFSSSRAFVNQFLVGTLVTIGLGGSVGLGTVWMRHQVSVVAESNSVLQKDIADIERQVANTRALVEEARSQEVLVRQNDAMRIGMVELNPAQVFAVREDPIQLLVARANRRFFESERGTEIHAIQLHFDSAVSSPVATARAVTRADMAHQNPTQAAVQRADAAPTVRLALD